MYRQEFGIPLGTNCASLIAYLFLIYYERDFMMSLPDDKQANIIDFFNTTSGYLDDILQKGYLIYTSELQLNKANASDTEGGF